MTQMPSLRFGATTFNQTTPMQNSMSSLLSQIISRSVVQG
jgi:hypothetical protein